MKMIKYIQIFKLITITIIWLFLGSTVLRAQALVPVMITPGCDYLADEEVLFDYTATATAGSTNYFVLTNNDGLISQINQHGDFGLLEIGGYLVYIVSTSVGSTLDSFEIGELITDTGSTESCYDISAPYHLSVCPTSETCSVVLGSSFEIEAVTSGNPGTYTRYVLVDEFGMIQDVQTDGFFDSPSTAGHYYVYIVSYDDQLGNSTLERGTSINNVTLGICQDWSSPVILSVCALAKLGNYVWHDCNGDGLQGVSERGVAGVEVSLYTSAGVFVTSQTTDANGFYEINNILSGNYYVSFDPPSGYEFSFPNQGFFLGGDSDVTGRNGLGTTNIQFLSPGECDNDSFDAGLYQCVSIGETVWYDTDEDDIFDDVENGINGLRVNLYKWHNNEWLLWDWQYTGHKPGTPSDDGYFKFCSSPGRYYLEYDLPPQGLVLARKNRGFDELRDSDVNSFGVFGANTTDEFTVVCGRDKCDIGAGFYPMATVGDRVWVDENGDGIRQGVERPVSGVTVEAYNVLNELVGSDVTDAQGSYEIDYLQKEDYYLKFYPPSGYGITTANIGDDEMDSDIDHSNGLNTTDFYSMSPGVHLPNVDAGVVFGVLPVELLSFSGRGERSHNQLDWITASEINASIFAIERRIGQDESFVSIGEVLAKGENGQGSEYAFEDYDVNQLGVYYYRLRMVDKDGQMSYSEVISIDVLGSALTSSEIKIYPNPTSNEVTFELSIGSNRQVSVELYNLMGQRVRDHIMSGEKARGKYVERVNLDGLPSGVYKFRIQLDKQTLVKSLIISD